MSLEIALIIFSAAIFILALFCIPILIQIWRTTKDLAVSLEALNQSFPVILKNLEEITSNINNSTTAVNREVQNLSQTVGRFQVMVKDVVDDIQHIAPIVVDSKAFQTVKSVVALIKGVRVFLEVLLAKK